MGKNTDFDAIRIQLASPERIREWSFGEVTKPETINYRSFKPERDGLFCERIFGPVKDWECQCGKYKRIRYRGVVCDRCGVEVTQAKVRRERMGHIELAVPVVHIWFLKSLPSRISYLLDVSVRNIERVVYYEAYVILDPGNSGKNICDILTEEEYLELEDQGFEFTAEMGAGAIKKLLAALEIGELSANLRAQVKIETSAQLKQEALKRLKVVEAFRQSNNRPQWMILDVIPVIPPDLRPLVPLEGGRFATSDLNDLYRRVINRNNRLKKLIEIKAPDVILRNEKRMLQEAVDALFDNGRRTRAVRGDGNRALKSLSDLLKGKQGRFRQNLLGKRVDYSGRSVIVVGPELKIHQCGLPKSMALELFKPFIIRKLNQRDDKTTIKHAKKMVERQSPEVWDILEELTKDHFVLLNRAPTLHRLGIQAFLPVLIEGKALQLHPLVCAAFNADFDGDQIAVHLPLSFEAQIEAGVLMLASHNILSPASGKPIVVDKPQCIALGCYYLTKVSSDTRGEGRLFSNREEAKLAYENGQIKLNSKVSVRIEGSIFETTVGRIIFNDNLPQGLPFVNKTIDAKVMKSIVGDSFRKNGRRITVEFLDKLKALGFRYATYSGISIGMEDVIIPDEKHRLVDEANSRVDEIREKYNSGVISDGERANQTIDEWSHTTARVAQTVFDALRIAEDGFNPLYVMADSGARGSQDQIKQLAGMRGLMQKPQKKITGGYGDFIETPITANFREGLSVLEYFISTHGSRKGLADTALKTAEAGYLTRRLVDVAQDCIVIEHDCGTLNGIEMTALKEGEQIVEHLGDRVFGRIPIEDIIDPETGSVICPAGELINEEMVHLINESTLDTILIRSVLTCESSRGICALCYGLNLAKGTLVYIGEAVGVVAAQSIGEPGTQLTLRTFHIGGAGTRLTEQSEITVKKGGKVLFTQNLTAVDYDDNTRVVTSRNGEINIDDSTGRIISTYQVPYGSRLLVKDGDIIENGATIYVWEPNHTLIVTDVAGTTRFENIIEGSTFRYEVDSETGHQQRFVIDQRNRTLTPHIDIIGKDDTRLRTYYLSVGSRIMIEDGEKIRAGETLAMIQTERFKTRDITSGLPRVAELFEARKPKDPAIISEIDGIVEIGGLIRGSRKVLVKGENDFITEYLIPYGKHLLVFDGDRVVAGERLTEGSVNPHDILRINGIHRVQEYLLNEIQEVYRLQGVKINDKHIEIIVRQMLQKVQIVDPGDTPFLQGAQVDKFTFAIVNKKVIDEGGEPATFEPLLLGITKASLFTESFFSAASFQETTRVLTEAAIQGKIDELKGLKENVIIGHLIPAGTGIRRYRNIRMVAPEDEFDRFVQTEQPAEDISEAVTEDDIVSTEDD
ncbi:DNA-directed RNA polymerase subunit beta' [bacterium]|nr:DNA-directed RNA polymerase subunit beta' [bacterium]